MGIVPYIVATAGHVDHGKSALVRALTGTDPDRLPEEKARGITIDLGFAHLDLPAPGNAGLSYRVGIVDVPGHEDFVKNMVAGVGSIDAALLVVAADDGWMPQTEEHLQILGYLGITRAVVAVTKIDLVADREPVLASVAEKLRGTSLADAVLVPTSTVSNQGIEALKKAIAALLAATPPQPDTGKPRLAVDRAFTLRGVGTVVTGTLTGGRLRKGQPVVVQPAGRTVKIRTIQSYAREAEQAVPGSRVALNLPDLPAGDAGRGVSRGDVIAAPDLGRGSDTLDVLVEISGRSALARPLKQGTRVRLHHASGNTPAMIYFLGTTALSAGDQALAQLRLDSPVYAFSGDRFILRDWPEQHTLAGCTVLDPDAVRRGFRSDDRLRFLNARANRRGDAKTFVASELARDGAATATLLLVKSPFSAADVAAEIQRLHAEKTIVIEGNIAADAKWWRELRNCGMRAIDAFHAAHPEQPGLRVVDLKQQLPSVPGGVDIFDVAVADLCRHGCVKSGVFIRRSSHQPALPPNLRPAGARLRHLLAAGALEPPSRKEIAPDQVSQQALRFLLQNGEAVEVGDEVVLAAEHYSRAVDSIREALRVSGPATVSELRQKLKTSRRIMVPLLEKLDREGITSRQGDKRVLRGAAN